MSSFDVVKIRLDWLSSSRGDASRSFASKTPLFSGILLATMDPIRRVLKFQIASVTSLSDPSIPAPHPGPPPPSRSSSSAPSVLPVLISSPVGPPVTGLLGFDRSGSQWSCRGQGWGETLPPVPALPSLWGRRLTPKFPAHNLPIAVVLKPLRLTQGFATQRPSEV